VSTAIPSASSTPAPAVPSASPSSLARGAIRGRIWHDLCAIGGGEGGLPARSADGCVPQDGGYRANGVYDAGEPGLAGIQVSLGSGACPAAVVAVDATEPDGTYDFVDLAPGVYCVSVGVSGSENVALLPGQWTHPPSALVTGEAAVAVTLGLGEAKSGVDFAWDYQFLPAPPTGLTTRPGLPIP
jgi:hypothetical protein